MKNSSVFDIIGPCMIGPSSSHTASALRIALMARTLVKQPVRTAEFILYGSFVRIYRGHGSGHAISPASTARLSLNTGTNAVCSALSPGNSVSTVLILCFRIFFVRKRASMRE